MVDTSDEWIVQRTGIRERHIVDEGEATSDLALRASQQALERAGVEPGEIDFIVVGTTTGDMAFPTTANILQHRLGCRNAGSIDLYAACAGSVYSLSVGLAVHPDREVPHRAVRGRGVPVAHHRLHRSRHVHPPRRRGGGGGVAGRRRTTPASSTPISTPTGATGSSSTSPGGGARHPATHETVDKRHALRQDEGQRGVQGGGAHVRRVRPSASSPATASPPPTSTSSSPTRPISGSSRRR